MTTLATMPAKVSAEPPGQHKPGVVGPGGEEALERASCLRPPVICTEQTRGSPLPQPSLAL